MPVSALRIGRSFDSFNHSGTLACQKQGQLCSCYFAVRVLLCDKVSWADQNIIHRKCKQTKTNRQTMTLNFKCHGLRAKQWRKTQHTYLLPISYFHSMIKTSVCSVLNDFSGTFSTPENQQVRSRKQNTGPSHVLAHQSSFLKSTSSAIRFKADLKARIIMYPHLKL